MLPQQGCPAAYGPAGREVIKATGYRAHLAGKRTLILRKTSPRRRL